jgi:hypothetical protein
MGTNADTYGTYDSSVAPAYVNFFNQRGYNCNATFHSGTNSGAAIITEINNNRPAHLMLHNHRMYGDHSVLAVGYKQYKYAIANSNYIRIVDGWINSPTRFVWGGCYGTWNYVSVVGY